MEGCVGDRLRSVGQRGVPIVDYRDAVDLDGILALQIHSGQKDHQDPVPQPPPSRTWVIGSGRPLWKRKGSERAGRRRARRTGRPRTERWPESSRKRGYAALATAAAAAVGGSR